MQFYDPNTLICFCIAAYRISGALLRRGWHAGYQWRTAPA
jgi:hypothetical protein